MRALVHGPREAPLEAALRLARPLDLEREVVLAYERAFRRHGNADLAALEACEEWFPVPAVHVAELEAA